MGTIGPGRPPATPPRHSRTFACLLPLFVLSLLWAPAAFADGGIGLPIPSGPIPSPVAAAAAVTIATPTRAVDDVAAAAPPAQALVQQVSTIAARAVQPAAAALVTAAPHPAQKIVTAAHALVLPVVAHSSEASATAAAPTAPARDLPAHTHVQALAGSHRPHQLGRAVARHGVTAARPSAQADGASAGRARLLPAAPAPKRPLPGVPGGAASSSAAGLLLPLFAAVAAVLAVVQPGLGGRAVSLRRAPRPTALTLDLERPG